MLAPSTIDERLPVWTALADLFLDTQLIETDLQRIAGILERSPYDVSELDRILREEVSPAFSFNLRSIAGEWAGWSDEDVRQIMMESLSRSGDLLSRLGWRIIPEDWITLKAMLE